MQGPLLNALSDNLQQLDESLQFSEELLTPNQLAIPSLPRDEQEWRHQREREW